MPRTASIPCAGGCGKLCWKSRTCRPPGEQMCRGCQLAETKAKSAIPDAICAFCGQPFCSLPRKGGRTETCSKVCSGKLGAVRRGHSLGRRSPERARDLARKCSRRRAVMADGDLTLAYIAELKANSFHCPLCSIEMCDEPFRPDSKELDHIRPLLLAGGTHTMDNVRIICRYCNLRRPNDGSDEHRAASLLAQEVA